MTSEVPKYAIAIVDCLAAAEDRPTEESHCERKFKKARLTTRKRDVAGQIQLGLLFNEHEGRACKKKSKS